MIKKFFSKKSGKDGEMSFLEHLEELRWHIFRSAIGVVFFMVLCFMNKEFIFDEIIFRPMDIKFFTYRFFCEISKFLSQYFPSLFSPDDFCVSKLNFTLISTELAGQFMSHVWVSLILGIIISFPYIFYEIWKFVKPALKDKERAKVTGVVFWVSILFILGVSFGYYIIFPISIQFLSSYSISSVVANQIQITSYISSMSILVLSSGLVFQLPILIYFLTAFGIVTAKMLRKSRSIALLSILVIAGIITPPDVASQIIVSIPLLILYEISIFIAARTGKNIGVRD